LQGFDNNVNTIVNWWENNQVIAGISGHTLTAADVGRFTLGNFVASGISIAPHAINPDYFIGTVAPNIGRLQSPIGSASSPHIITPDNVAEMNTHMKNENMPPEDDDLIPPAPDEDDDGYDPYNPYNEPADRKEEDDYEPIPYNDPDPTPPDPELETDYEPLTPDEINEIADDMDNLDSLITGYCD
jgi:hypothetical protein